MDVVGDSRALRHPDCIRLIIHSFVCFVFPTEFSLTNTYYILETSSKKTSSLKELKVQCGVHRQYNAVGSNNRYVSSNMKTQRSVAVQGVWGEQQRWKVRD